MRLHHDAETQAFRAEFVAWVDENLPSAEDMRDPILSTAPPTAVGGEMAARRCSTPAGSCRAGRPSTAVATRRPLQQLVYHEDIAEREVPREFNPQGLSIISPSIIERGTQDQNRSLRHPAPAGRADGRPRDERAERRERPGVAADHRGPDGDRFVVNGQKVWTSGAQHADWCFTFVRTDPDVVKHAGISVLLIDMTSPGITVRPLPELTDLITPTSTRCSSTTSPSRPRTSSVG